MALKTLMTVEQFSQLATAGTEDYELVEGELLPLSSGTPRHARIRGRGERLLSIYLESKQLGAVFAELDCQLGVSTVRRPDLSVFLGDKHRSLDLDRIPVLFAPDIAVEVLSDSEKAMDVRRKVRGYLNAGTQEVWLLDHMNQEAVIHSESAVRILEAGDLLETALLPGFQARVGDLIGA